MNNIKYECGLVFNIKLSLWKIVRGSVILLLPLFMRLRKRGIFIVLMLMFHF